MSADHTPLPDPSRLLRELDLRTPLIGLYDAPDPDAFAPLVRPPSGPGRGPCLFNYYRRWEKGETLHLTAERFGCGGCGRSLFGVQVRERDDFIDFLWGDEGLRASRELMAGWVDNAPTYHPEHGNMLVGPLKPELAQYPQEHHLLGERRPAQRAAARRLSPPRVGRARPGDACRSGRAAPSSSSSPTWIGRTP